MRRIVRAALYRGRQWRNHSRAKAATVLVINADGENLDGIDLLSRVAIWKQICNGSHE